MIGDGEVSAVRSPKTPHDVPSGIRQGFCCSYDDIACLLQVNMFGGTGWELIEEPGEAPAVREPKSGRVVSIVRRNEFDHLRMTMSVVASDKGAGRGFHVFCKGYAPLSCNMLHACR